MTAIDREDVGQDSSGQKRDVAAVDREKKRGREALDREGNGQGSSRQVRPHSTYIVPPYGVLLPKESPGQPLHLTLLESNPNPTIYDSLHFTFLVSARPHPHWSGPISLSYNSKRH
ncbi:hypothetical protein Pmani_024154 [Petrolisthes manimaculis]|uniref:Uncharacterized protein n=1 Tax=Petrolisthes manimaculis TaxID=1843537 RepID=A0AAE1P9U3_9EUCA|nr:hypothetical protein Pmani_024154 [Petrolisthes manimaculis]